MPTNAPSKFDSFSFLVIDDEVFIQNLLVRLLRQMGASKIATASNGVEALAYLDAANPPPDVLLVDLSMPEMGGIELMHQLAGRAYKGAVVLVSGADPETLVIAEGLAKYRGVAMLGYVTKPVKPEALTEMLGKLG
jgi:CheY-like chemotaxis protein